jgi:hypothetical protein
MMSDEIKKYDREFKQKQLIHVITIRKACETSSSISKTVIYEFLIYYAAVKYNLHRPMTEIFSAYRHVTVEFEKEWVNRLSLKRWGGHPHFAQIYFDENKNIVLLAASTDRGFLALVNAINQ